MAARSTTLAAALWLAAAPLTALAQVRSEAPAVPSSYELRRAETQARLALQAQAREAKRKSRQIEQVGSGRAAGPGASSGLPFELSAKQAVTAGLLGLIGVAALHALTEPTEPTPVGGGGGAGAGPSTTATSSK